MCSILLMMFTVASALSSDKFQPLAPCTARASKVKIYYIRVIFFVLPFIMG